MGDGSTTFKFRKNELSELEQQATVVQLLERYGIDFAAVPNGHVRTRRQHITASREGVQKGMPDLLIFTPPPALYGKVYAVGVALEMKRAEGRSRDVRASQRKWLRTLAGHGWIPVAGYGASDAIAHLKALGYFPDFELNERAMSPTTLRRLPKFQKLIETAAPTKDYIALHKDDKEEE